MQLSLFYPSRGVLLATAVGGQLTDHLGHEADNTRNDKKGPALPSAGGSRARFALITEARTDLG